jgi:Uri superfamily endonuclease
MCVNARTVATRLPHSACNGHDAAGPFNMQADPGSYALILRCDARADIRVGRLGCIGIQPGYYLYTGSAFGPGGVRARVARHCRGGGSRHWHIDYLRMVATPVSAWYSHAPDNLEHRWAQALSEMDGVKAVKGFGCSDCRCYAHLFHLARKPVLARFARAVGGSVASWRCP